jgi:exodeoxyribonuclease-3
MYTYWSYLRNRWGRDAGLRLDQLLLTSDLAIRLDDAGVDRKIRGHHNASDHAPAWIVLRGSVKPLSKKRKRERPSAHHSA